MFGVEQRVPMWQLMLGTVRRSADDTGTDCGLFDTRAHVTPNHLLCQCPHKRVGAACRVCYHGVTLQCCSGPDWYRKPGSLVTSLFVFVSDESKDFVDAELRTLIKMVLAEGTSADGARGPVTSDTRLHGTTTTTTTTTGHRRDLTNSVR